MTCSERLHRWNAARAFASYLDEHEDLYRDGYVLELGAGGGLPGIVTALNGACKVRVLISSGRLPNVN